jgi:hypothetical protein
VLRRIPPKEYIVLLPVTKADILGSFIIKNVIKYNPFSASQEDLIFSMCSYTSHLGLNLVVLTRLESESLWVTRVVFSPPLAPPEDFSAYPGENIVWVTRWMPLRPKARSMGWGSTDTRLIIHDIVPPIT